MQIAVIIPAAGASRRYQDSGDGLSARSKLEEDLGGRPMLQRTVELFTKHADVGAIIVAGPADNDAFAQFKLRHSDKLGLLGAQLCQGGASHRYETVANALKLVPASATHVAVHDAARPCTSPELIEAVFDAARQGHNAVIPGVDVPDTLKRVDPTPIVNQAPDPLAAILGTTDQAKPIGRAVSATIDRTNVVGVQTPQVFEVGLLRRAYAQKDLSSTDDAQLVERLGEAVLVVPGDPRNIKVTRASDIHLARAILDLRPPSSREAHKRF